MAQDDEAVVLLPQPFTPLADAEGRPRTRLAPYLPVVGACSLCPARCCRLHVKLSVPDAVHFAVTLGVPLFAGLRPVASEDPEHAFRLDRDPRVVAEDAPWPGTAELELVRRPDGGCHALVQVGAHERCGVYGARPSFCRTYPVAWRGEKMEGGPKVIMCPVPYGIDPDEEARLRADLARSIRLWAAHDALVAEWNATPGPHTVEAFSAFAVPRAAAVLGVRADGVLAEGHREQRLYDAMLAAKVVAPPKFRLAPEPARPFADLPSPQPRKT
jgi:Fe-S-cluster containining protein